MNAVIPATRAASTPADALHLVVAGPPSVTLRGVQHLLDDDHRFAVDGVLTLQGPRSTAPVALPSAHAPSLVVLVEPDVERLAGTARLLGRLLGPEVPVLALLRAVDRVPPEQLLGVAGCIASDCPPSAVLSAAAATATGHRVFDRRISRVGAPTTPGAWHAARRVETLGPRHHAVLGQVRVGRTNRQIAAALALSEAGVKKIVTDLMGRLGASNRVQLAVLASTVPVTTTPTDRMELA